MMGTGEVRRNFSVGPTIALIWRGFKQFAKSPRRHGSHSLFLAAQKADTYTLPRSST
jgi:hypothetical protein